LDTSHRTNNRIDCTVTDITNKSFKVIISTWNNSVIYGVQVSWLAHDRDTTASISGHIRTPWSWREHKKLYSADTILTLDSVESKTAFGFSHIDTDLSYNTRVRALLTEGHKIKIEAWSDSIIYGVGVNWFTHSPLSMKILSGVVRTPWTCKDPQKIHKEAIKFRVPLKSPTVVLGIRELDFDKKYNTRVIVKATNITDDGFELEICSWNDTIMYGVSAQWLAFSS